MKPNYARLNENLVPYLFVQWGAFSIFVLILIARGAFAGRVWGAVLIVLISLGMTFGVKQHVSHNKPGENLLMLGLWVGAVMATTAIFVVSALQLTDGTIIGVAALMAGAMFFPVGIVTFNALPKRMAYLAFGISFFMLGLGLMTYKVNWVGNIPISIYGNRTHIGIAFLVCSFLLVFRSKTMTEEIIEKQKAKTDPLGIKEKLDEKRKSRKVR